MAVSRNQLVLGLVSIFWLAVLVSSGIAVENSGCLSCHQPHRAGLNDCVYCHAGNPETKRKEIAHYRLIAARYSSFRDPQSSPLQRGEKLVKALGCRRCHRIGGEGNRLATDLDLLAKRVTPEMRELSIKEPVLYMPDFHLEPADRAAIVTYLLAAQLKVKPTATPPKVVHFAAENSTERTFDKFCGTCHQLLSARWGAIGFGKTAPNLSGLFSKFYPTPPRKGESWTTENLQKWIENPRKFRPFANMPPLVLKKQELERLFSELRHAEQPLEAVLSDDRP